MDEPDGIYFITITCFKWLPLFTIADSYDAVYKWFHYLKLNSHYITGYVIMPNHLYALIAFSNTGKNINQNHWEWQALYGLWHRR